MAERGRDNAGRRAAGTTRDSYTRLVSMDERMRAGRAFVIDSHTPRLEELARTWSEAAQVEAFTAQTLEGISDRLRKPRDGRPRIRGFLVHWKPQVRPPVTALEAISGIRDAYPRTPICVFGDPSRIQASVRVRSNVQLIEAAELASDPLPCPPALRAAYVGVLRMQDPRCSVPVLDEQRLIPEALLDCERELYAPWDAHCRRVRRWLLDRVAEGEKLEEYHLRTLDAYFESVVDPTKLANARAVDPATLDQYTKEIRRVLGGDMACIKAEWEIEHLGQGAPLLPDPLVRRPRPSSPPPARPPRARAPR